MGITVSLRTRISTSVLVLVYLAAIVLANLTLSLQLFGPLTIFINSFLFIGFDLLCRDLLHDRWRTGPNVLNDGRMGMLIAIGAGISYALNAHAGSIAIASFLAFYGSNMADAFAYGTSSRPRFQRSMRSNLVGAVVDSLVFPLIAFGMFSPMLTLGMITAKVVGGFVWYGVLRPLVKL